MLFRSTPPHVTTRQGGLRTTHTPTHTHIQSHTHTLPLPRHCVCVCVTSLSPPLSQVLLHPSGAVRVRQGSLLSAVTPAQPAGPPHRQRDRYPGNPGTRRGPFLTTGVTMGTILARKVLSTDASRAGWGAVYEGRSINGMWSRSEERRVGKECLRLCRSRWSPYH